MQKDQLGALATLNPNMPKDRHSQRLSPNNPNSRNSYNVSPNNTQRYTTDRAEALSTQNPNHSDFGRHQATDLAASASSNTLPYPSADSPPEARRPIKHTDLPKIQTNFSPPPSSVSYNPPQDNVFNIPTRPSSSENLAATVASYAQSRPLSQPPTKKQPEPGGLPHFAGAQSSTFTPAPSRPSSPAPGFDLPKFPSAQEPSLPSFSERPPSPATLRPPSPTPSNHSSRFKNGGLVTTARNFGTNVKTLKTKISNSNLFKSSKTSSPTSAGKTKVKQETFTSLDGNVQVSPNGEHLQHYRNHNPGKPDPGFPALMDWAAENHSKPDAPKFSVKVKQDGVFHDVNPQDISLGKHDFHFGNHSPSNLIEQRK
jgi:hypothetical protein